MEFNRGCLTAFGIGILLVVLVTGMMLNLWMLGEVQATLDEVRPLIAAAQPMAASTNAPEVATPLQMVEAEAATPIPLPTLAPTAIPAESEPVAAGGVSHEQICDVDERNMTDPQLAAHAAQFAGETFSGWQGWVYDVVSRVDGTYNLEIAMEERGVFFWTRDIVVENIPAEMATSLGVEQVIVFDGRVARVEYALEVMCNPLVVDQFVLHP